MLGAMRVKRQVDAGADSDIENAALRRARDALAKGTQLLVAHRELDERRENPIIVESHLHETTSSESIDP